MLKFLLEKEFKQFMRNPVMPRMVLIMPLVMMIVFPLATNRQVQDITISIVDNDKSQYSMELVNKITSSGYFILADYSSNYSDALKSIEKGSAYIILEIEKDFEKNIVKEGSANVMISANTVDIFKGSVGASYLSNIIYDYSLELQEKLSFTNMGPAINIIPLNEFNQTLNYKNFMIPAIMVMLVTMITCFLPTLNIVSEKEKGTMEQINVTPVNKFIFILSKLIPYLIMGIIVFTICIIIAKFLYHLDAKGGILSLYIFTLVYVFVSSGLGLIISNYSYSMQQAMFVMFFFVMILFFMSNLFTPVAYMPEWGQWIAAFNPLKYYGHAVRSIYLKGAVFSDMYRELIILGIFAVVLNVLAVISYKKNE